jgi:hypothetical protein
LKGRIENLVTAVEAGGNKPGEAIGIKQPAIALENSDNKPTGHLQTHSSNKPQPTRNRTMIDRTLIPRQPYKEPVDREYQPSKSIKVSTGCCDHCGNKRPVHKPSWGHHADWTRVLGVKTLDHVCYLCAEDLACARRAHDHDDSSLPSSFAAHLKF